MIISRKDAGFDPVYRVIVGRSAAKGKSGNALLRLHWQAFCRTRHRNMSAFLAAMRDGRWLTRERIRLWALAVLAAIGCAFLAVTSDGLNDYQGRPLGTDFSNVYAAGTYVLDGKPDKVAA